MPEQTKTQAPKNKQTHKPIVERAEPELASEPPVEIDELTSDIARQLAVPPKKTQGSHQKPRFTPKQIKHLQRYVGNQATQRLLSVPGSARVQRRDDYNIPPSPAPTPSPEQGPSQSPGSQDTNAPLESEDFEGYQLKNDSAVLENILLGVISKGGIEGAEKFVQRYSFKFAGTPAHEEFYKKVYPQLNSKCEDLKSKALAYAEGPFFDAASRNLETIIEGSQKALDSEKKHYGLEKRDAGPGGITYPEKKEQEIAEMGAEAKKLAAFQAKIDDLVKRKESLEYPITKKEYPDIEVSKYVKPTVTQVGTGIKDPAAHKAIVEEMTQVQKAYDIARFSAEARFPILASFKPPDGLSKLETMAKGDKNAQLNTITEELYEKETNIAKLRKEVRTNFVYKQDSIVGSTKQILGVAPGSLEEAGINFKKDKVESKEFWINLGLALAGIVGGILLAIPTAGSSVAAVGVGISAGAGLATIQKGIQEYNIAKAASGNNFDKARCISQQDPSLFWLAVDIIGAVVDIAGATKAFTRAATAIREASKLKNIDEAVEVAHANGGLSGVVSKEQLKDRMIANGLLDPSKAPKAKTAFSWLEDAAHPTTKLLLSGDPKSIKDLIKSWGNWESLIGQLDLGTPEMKRISTLCQSYRKNFMAPLEKAGFKTQATASSHGTSDIDIYSSTDAASGAGEKLIEAEKKLTADWGSTSWDVDLRINFYTDLKSRLVLPDLMPMLSEAEKAALLIEQSKIAREYTMARRLQTAAGNPEMITRIEKEAIDAGDNLEQIKKLASQGEDKAMRDAALREADGWESKYEYAKNLYKYGNPPTEEAKQTAIKYGKELQKAQMRANFYTKEAVIAPGTAMDILKLPNQEGLRVADAILEWTSMLEHKIAEYGTVTRALREYEPWKYMGRIVAQAQNAKIDEALLSRLKLIEERAKNIVPAEVRSEKWAQESSHLGGDARLDAGNLQVYRQFQANVSQLGTDIRASEMKKLEALATKTE